MKFLLLSLVFVHLSVAAKADIVTQVKRFCIEGCPYLKSIDKDPNAKINFKKLYEKCKTDNKAPKFICEDDDKPDKATMKAVERVTWAQVCKVVCGK